MSNKEDNVKVVDFKKRPADIPLKGLDNLVTELKTLQQNGDEIKNIIVCSVIGDDEEIRVYGLGLGMDKLDKAVGLLELSKLQMINAAYEEDYVEFTPE